MENKKQTAVQRLSRFMEEHCNPSVCDISFYDFKQAISEALEMEKQQIIEAFNLGQQKEAKQEFWTKGEQYYKETYED
jgi:hypothetical protein